MGFIVVGKGVGLFVVGNGVGIPVGCNVVGLEVVGALVGRSVWPSTLGLSEVGDRVVGIFVGMGTVGKNVGRSVNTENGAFVTPPGDDGAEDVQSQNPHEFWVSKLYRLTVGHHLSVGILGGVYGPVLNGGMSVKEMQYENVIELYLNGLAQGNPSMTKPPLVLQGPAGLNVGCLVGVVGDAVRGAPMGGLQRATPLPAKLQVELPL